MTELGTILNKLEAAKKMASVDPDDPEYSKTKAGIAVAVQHAKDNLKGLLKDYESALFKNGVAIFLFGPPEKTKAFSGLVTEMGEAVVVDAGEMYSRLADAVERSLGPSRESGPTQLALMQARLSDIGREIGVIVRPSYTYQPSFPLLQTKEDVLKWVRNVAEVQVGDVLAVEYMRRSFTTAAEKIRYMLNVAPVILVNATPEEANKLSPMFGKGSANVEITEDTNVDKEYITQTFQNVNKSLKKSKQ